MNELSSCPGSGVRAANIAELVGEDGGGGVSHVGADAAGQRDGICECRYAGGSIGGYGQTRRRSGRSGKLFQLRDLQHIGRQVLVDGQAAGIDHDIAAFDEGSFL